MRFLSASILVFLVPLTSLALNIILNNDDGFASANIRELYRLLNAAGHNAWIVAPVINQSGKGGTEVFTTEATLTAPSEYDIVPKGAPSFGTDPNDSHIWYYNGTPATCTFFALDYVVPRYWPNGTTPDLLLSGPNFGTNLGPFLYTLSGTIGAAYAAVERSLPAIAFSAGNNGQRSYKEVNKTTPSGYPDPATVAAELSVALVDQLAKKGNSSQLLPLGYGLTVNYPAITSLKSAACVAPPFIQTRMTGGAEVDTAVLDPATGLFSYGSIVSAGANTCINGDCSLPGETNVVGGGCFSSVSVFTVDYDAPSPGSGKVRRLLEPLVKYQNVTGNATVATKMLRRRLGGEVGVVVG